MTTRQRNAGRHRAAATLAVLGLLAVSGCAGSADAAGGDGDYTVMTWAPDGTGSADRAGVTALAEAIGRDVNAKGGMSGHRLHVLTCNEHNSVEGVSACVRQAVDAKVVAVIGSYSQYGDSFMPALEAAGIPYIGGYGLSGPEFSSPFSYPVAGGTPALIAGSGRQLVAAGCGTVAVVRPDTRAGDTLTRYLSGSLAPAGVKLTDVRVVEKTPDYADAARRALGDDRQGGCVIIALGPEQTLKVLDAYRQLGAKHTQLASLIGSIQQSMVDSSGGANSPLNGAYVTGWYPPESSGVWDGLRSDAAGNSRIATSDLAVQTTWVAYQVLLQAADRLKSAGQPLTARTLRGQLDSGDTLDTGGVTPPLTWGMGDMLPSAESPRLVNTWVTFQQVKGGQLVQQQSGFIDVRWALTGGKPPQ